MLFFYTNIVIKANLHLFAFVTGVFLTITLHASYIVIIITVNLMLNYYYIKLTSYNKDYSLLVFLKIFPRPSTSVIGLERRVRPR